MDRQPQSNEEKVKIAEITALKDLIHQRLPHRKWEGGIYSDWLVRSQKIREIFEEVGLLAYLEGIAEPPSLSLTRMDIEHIFDDCIEQVLEEIDALKKSHYKRFSALTGDIPMELLSRYQGEVLRFHHLQITKVRNLEELRKIAVSRFNLNYQMFQRAQDRYLRDLECCQMIFKETLGEISLSMVQEELSKNQIHEAWTKLDRIELALCSFK